MHLSVHEPVLPMERKTFGFVMDEPLQCPWSGNIRQIPQARKEPGNRAGARNMNRSAMVVIDSTAWQANLPHSHLPDQPTSDNRHPFFKPRASPSDPHFPLI